MYWPPCELKPWQITTIAFGAAGGCHDRRKIFSPPTSIVSSLAGMSAPPDDPREAMRPHDDQRKTTARRSRAHSCAPPHKCARGRRIHAGLADRRGLKV